MVSWCPRNSHPSAPLNLHCLPKERGTNWIHISFHPECTPHSLALGDCCECWICSAKIPAVKICYFFLDKFSGKIQSCSIFLHTAFPSFFLSAGLTQTIAFTSGSLSSLGALRSPGGWSALPPKQKKKEIQRAKHTWQLFLVFFLLLSSNTADVSGKSPALLQQWEEMFTRLVYMHIFI